MVSNKKISELTASTAITSTDTIPVVHGGATEKVRVDWLTGGVYNVKHYGATGDGVTDDLGAIQTAIEAAVDAGGGVVVIPEGTYYCSDKLSLEIVEYIIIAGCGRHSNIVWTNSSIDCLVEFGGARFRRTTIKDLRLTGPGKAVGTAINGIYAHSTMPSEDVNFDGVLVEDVSGSGFVIDGWFSSTIRRCAAQSCGQHGMVFDSSTTCLIEGGGAYNDDIDGTSLWVVSGNALVRNFNSGTCDIGMRFGATVGNNPLEAAAAYSKPTIIGANIEPCVTTGVLFESGSYPMLMNGVILYAAADTAVTYGVKMDYIGTGVGIVSPVTFSVKSGGSWTNKYYIAGGTVGKGGIVFLTNIIEGSPDAVTLRYTYPLLAGIVERMVAWVQFDSQNPSLGVLPAYSVVTGVLIQVVAAFNSDGDDTISVGYDAAPEAYATSTDVSSTGLKAVTSGALVGYNATSRSIEAYYVNSGTEPTEGSAIVVLEFYRVPSS